VLAVAACGASAWLSGGGEDATNEELAAVLGYPAFLGAVGTIPIGYPEKRVGRRFEGRAKRSRTGTAMMLRIRVASNHLSIAAACTIVFGSLLRANARGSVGALWAGATRQPHSSFQGPTFTTKSTRSGCWIPVQSSLPLSFRSCSRFLICLHSQPGCRLVRRYPTAEKKAFDAWTASYFNRRVLRLRLESKICL
jgi:hypothetical protein